MPIASALQRAAVGIADTAKKVTWKTSDADPVARALVSQRVADHFSTFDKLKGRVGEDVASTLLNNSVNPTKAVPAVAYTQTAHGAGALELQGLRRTLDSLTGSQGMGRFTQVGKKTADRNDLLSKAHVWMMQEHHNEVMGVPPQAAHADPRAAQVIKAIQDSGYAVNSLDRLQKADVFGAADIRKSSNYVPVKWLGHKLKAFIAGDVGIQKQLAGAFGSQIARQHPYLITKNGLTTEQIGQGFLKTQFDKLDNKNNMNFRGTDKEDLLLILKNSGVDEATANHIVNVTSVKTAEASKLSPLKSRISWDGNVSVLSDGRSFSVYDFMDQNVEMNLLANNNTTSAAIGLAHAGYRSKAELTAALKPGRDMHLGDAEAHRNTNDFLDNIERELNGQAVNGEYNTLLQATSVASALLSLKNAGIYNAVDIVHSVQTFGLSTVMKKFIPSMKGMWSAEKMSLSTANTIQDIIRNQLVNEGRMQTVITHMESNFNTPHTWPTQLLNLASQSVKFLNLSEPIRRSHLNLITGILGDLTEKFGTGDVKAAKYFESLGFTPEELTQIRDFSARFGQDMTNWEPKLANKFAAVLTRSVDAHAFMARKGDVPAWLAHSEVGRVLVPYFSFVAAANNKILRKNYRANGATGVAMHMAHFAPLAVLAGMSINVIDGKEPTDNLVSKSLGIIPTVGFFTAPIGLLDRGEYGGTPTAFALVNKSAAAAKSIADGDVAGAIKNLPGASIMPAVRILTSALKED